MGEWAPIRWSANRNGSTEFVLAERPGQEPITISQKDVRELQLAKAAIRLGIQALVASGGTDRK